MTDFVCGVVVGLVMGCALTILHLEIAALREGRHTRRAVRSFKREMADRAMDAVATFGGASPDVPMEPPPPPPRPRPERQQENKDELRRQIIQAREEAIQRRKAAETNDTDVRWQE